MLQDIPLNPIHQDSITQHKDQTTTMTTTLAKTPSENMHDHDATVRNKATRRNNRQLSIASPDQGSSPLGFGSEAKMEIEKQDEIQLTLKQQIDAMDEEQLQKLQKLQIQQIQQLEVQPRNGHNHRQSHHHHSRGYSPSTPPPPPQQLDNQNQDTTSIITGTGKTTPTLTKNNSLFGLTKTRAPTLPRHPTIPDSHSIKNYSEPNSQHLILYPCIPVEGIKDINNNNNDNTTGNIHDVHLTILNHLPNSNGSLPQQPPVSSIPLDSAQDPSSLFSNDAIKKGFMRKVLSIICLQLVITTSFIILSTCWTTYSDFQKQNKWLYITCLCVNITLLLGLYCYRDACRKVPNNYIMLLLYTLSESYLLSYLCSVTESAVVLLAGGLTTFLVSALTIYAFCSKTDVTLKTSMLVYLPMAVLVIIVVSSGYQGYIGQVLVSLAIIGLFALYLVFDLQRLSAKSNLQYSIDDYIIAALDIYIDIVIIFKEIVYLLSR